MVSDYIMRHFLRPALFVFCLTFHFGAKSQLFINEFEAYNASDVIDSTTKEFSDWIELYNPDILPVSLDGYSLSDDSLVPQKWVFPAGTVISAYGCLLIWADKTNTGLHSSFSISGTSGYIGLYNALQQKVDGIIYTKQFEDVSYGRSVDGSPAWCFFYKTTPGASNIFTGCAGIQTSSPDFSIKGGRYASSQVLNLTTVSPGGEIYYTTNGSVPDEKSHLYTVPINIDSTTVIRVKVFENDRIPSPVLSQTYLIAEHNSNLPVFSITTDSANLWNDSIGIYKNYTKDWQRPMNIEMYDEQGLQLFNCRAGFEIYGNASRSAAQKSFSIKFDGKYGMKSISAKLFDDKKNTKYSCFILRNSGNDNSSTHFRDGILQCMFAGKMNIDYQAFHPAVVYLNGKYWGILNIRETMNETYPENNYDIDKDSVDVYSSEKGVVHGSITEYLAIATYLKSNDMSVPANYEYVKTLMDIDEFIEYNIAEIYLGNNDFPCKNLKAWQPAGPGGRWRWLLYDLDITMGIWGMNPSANTLGYLLNPPGGGCTGYINGYYFLKYLMKNPEFKKEFTSRFLYHLNTTFKPDRVNSFIDSAKNWIGTEMPYHIARWGGSINAWNRSISEMKNYAALRQLFFIDSIAAVLSCGKPVQVCIYKNIPEAGTIFIDNKIIPDNIYNYKLFSGFQSAIRATSKPGYVFKYWDIKTTPAWDSIIIPRKAVWKYFDTNYIPSAIWFSNSYNDSSWSEGYGKFGYGDTALNTLINIGPDQPNIYTASYYRKWFFISDTSLIPDTVTIGLAYDDGLVVYLNGVEITRYNINPGIVNYSTTSSSAIMRNCYVPVKISKKILMNGNNLIAVELHQSKYGAFRAVFDLEMKYRNIGITDSVSYGKNLLDTLFNDETVLTAVFEKFNFNKILFINEVQSKNTGVLLDEFGESDDWIEIYNSGNDTFDIAGLFITDSVTQTHKSMIPFGYPEKTRISPGGFLLLWADNQNMQGPLHLDFKLSANGSFMGLFNDDSLYYGYIDSMTVPYLQADSSYGRLPDAGDTLTVFTIPTPGKSNVINEIPVIFIKNNEIAVSIFPNPVQNHLMIRTDQRIDRIEIINTLGQKVYESSRELLPGVSDLDVSGLQDGIYILILHINGNRIFSKMIKEMF